MRKMRCRRALALEEEADCDVLVVPPWPARYAPQYQGDPRAESGPLMRRYFMAA